MTGRKRGRPPQTRPSNMKRTPPGPKTDSSSSSSSRSVENVTLTNTDRIAPPSQIPILRQTRAISAIIPSQSSSSPKSLKSQSRTFLPRAAKKSLMNQNVSFGSSSQDSQSTASSSGVVPVAVGTGKNYSLRYVPNILPNTRQVIPNKSSDSNLKVPSSKTVHCGSANEVIGLTLPSDSEVQIQDITSQKCRSSKSCVKPTLPRREGLRSQAHNSELLKTSFTQVAFETSENSPSSSGNPQNFPSTSSVEQPSASRSSKENESSSSHRYLLPPTANTHQINLANHSSQMSQLSLSNSGQNFSLVTPLENEVINVMQSSSPEVQTQGINSQMECRFAHQNAQSESSYIFSSFLHLPVDDVLPTHTHTPYTFSHHSNHGHQNSRSPLLSSNQNICGTYPQVPIQPANQIVAPSQNVSTSSLYPELLPQPVIQTVGANPGVTHQVNDRLHSFQTFSPSELPLPPTNNVTQSSLAFALPTMVCSSCFRPVPSADIEPHLIECTKEPKNVPSSYNEEFLFQTLNECCICLEHLAKGEVIARLPCLCIYHKICIEKWFNIRRVCPNHPDDNNIKL